MFTRKKKSKDNVPHVEYQLEGKLNLKLLLITNVYDFTS